MIVGFLQNFRDDPAFSRRTCERRFHGDWEAFVSDSIHHGPSLTSRRLRETFGEDLRRIIFANVATGISIRTWDKFNTNFSHIHRVLNRFSPSIVLAFGGQARNALLKIHEEYPFQLIIGPHPAARHGEVLSMLREMHRLTFIGDQ